MGKSYCLHDVKKYSIRFDATPLIADDGTTNEKLYMVAGYKCCGCCANYQKTMEHYAITDSVYTIMKLKFLELPNISLYSIDSWELPIGAKNHAIEQVDSDRFLFVGGITANTSTYDNPDAYIYFRSNSCNKPCPKIHTETPILQKVFQLGRL